MSRLTLPQGQSLRQVAERLGVPVEELVAHSGIKDAEAPLPVARSIEVPDGFLKSRTKKEDLRDAVVQKSSTQTGMNMWLALDIEQKRTRASGGMHAHTASEDETTALAEARRAYLRFENESNELAIALYAQASITASVDVRARAFAGQALALAQRCLRFGEPPQRARAQAISAAKAALLADPKLADAHLAMGLGLLCGAAGADFDEAQAALEYAAHLAPKDPFVWADLAGLLLGRGDLEGARVAVAQGRAAGAPCVLVLDADGFVALAAGEAARAKACFDEALAHTETYLMPRVGLAAALARLDESAAAAQELDAALQAAHGERERALLQRIYDSSL